MISVAETNVDCTPESCNTRDDFDHYALVATPRAADEWLTRSWAAQGPEEQAEQRHKHMK
jgi:hypothetical protein